MVRRLGSRQMDVLTHIDQVLTKNSTSPLSAGWWQADPDTAIPASVLNGLLDRGLIARNPAPDGLVIGFHLTDAGRQAFVDGRG